MRTPRRIEVEPLSEQRWEKIERSLFARLEGLPLASGEPTRLVHGLQRRRWTLAVAALVSVGAAILFAAYEREQLPAEPWRISTGTSALHWTLRGLTLDVEPESEVVLGPETPGGRQIAIERGGIVCDVAPRAKASPLVVKAGVTRVRVVGTRFRVTRQADAASVRVEQGVVEVDFRGERWRVEAGQSWAPAEAPSPSAQPNPLPDVGAGPLPGDVDVQPPPTVERAAADRRSPRSRPDTSPTTKRSPVAVEPPRDPAPSRQASFERATALERSDPTEAARLYREIEGGGDSWSQHALYARGRLEASRGNHVEARSALTRYLERFPLGTNAEDARAVLKRLK